MGLEIRVRKLQQNLLVQRGVALTLTLEIWSGRVSLPKIVKLLGWLCWDVPHNFVFELSKLE